MSGHAPAPKSGIPYPGVIGTLFATAVAAVFVGALYNVATTGEGMKKPKSETSGEAKASGAPAASGAPSAKAPEKK